MAHMKAVRLLTALELMPLEDISEDAEQWRQDIREAIEELEGPTGLPADDPLRYDEDGNLITRERLERRLQTIIDSWPTFGLSEGALWQDRS
jgi:hypothetical protein